ncbi:MAG: DUF4279 domain-containing protein [Terracidiphilus sp.]
MEEEFEDDMKWSRATFRIFGDSLGLEEVTSSLGIQATSSGLKGEILSSSRLKKPLRTSIWRLASPLNTEQPLEDHLNWLLDVLEPKSDVVSKLAKEFDVDFFCGFSSANGQGGFTLDPALLARLARLTVPLFLDLYPPGPITLESD